MLRHRQRYSDTHPPWRNDTESAIGMATFGGEVTYEVSAAMEHVAGAHKWPELPKLHMSVDDLDESGATAGQFGLAAVFGFEHWSLILNRKTLYDLGPTTAVHELAHYLDAGLVVNAPHDVRESSGKMASQMAARDTPEGRAFLGDEAMDAWHRFFKAAVTQSIVEDDTLSPHYYRSPHELWARAYTQWIASQNDDLYDDMDTHSVDGWPPEEWEAVGEAVEDVLRAHGLLYDVDNPAEEDYAWQTTEGADYVRPVVPPLHQPMNPNATGLREPMSEAARESALRVMDQVKDTSDPFSVREVEVAR